MVYYQQNYLPLFSIIIPIIYFIYYELFIITKYEVKQYFLDFCFILKMLIFLSIDQLFKNFMHLKFL